MSTLWSGSRMPSTSTQSPKRSSSCGSRAPMAVDAEMIRLVRIAAEMAALDHQVLGQQAGQRAHRGRFACPLLPPYQNSADGGVDRVQDQRQLHLLLADDGRERIGITT